MIHISNNFVSSSVHASLISKLSGKVGAQLVVVPIRDKSHAENSSEIPVDCSVEYLFFRNKILRFFPLLKVLFLSKKIKPILEKNWRMRTGQSGNFDIIAHNFWSDGMLAFINSFFIPMRYLLVVRNTDINYFIAKLPHYRGLMAWAIRRSEGLVFVSRSHYLRFRSRWPELLDQASKVKVIPNALSDWWLDNIVDGRVFREKKACFVGRFDANKNLSNLLKAAELVHKVDPEFRLALVGGDVSDLRAVIGGAAIPDYVEVLGRLTPTELLKVYRNSRVFVMPSFTETFGLVYLEALSQGCSVICSRGEGIDGIWDTPFIRAVDPVCVKAIAGDLVDLIGEFPEGVPLSWINREIRKFDWEYVSAEYLEFFS
ncbi:MAG: glycosyltransferase [Pseudomonadales bacterium]|nr:glycosyltransferase [Pseudomonadales bacterium]